jgi:predicted dehydrogenase
VPARRSHAHAADLGQHRPTPHVFVEKPLSYSLGEANQIVARQRQTGLVVQVGYVKRHNPAYRHVQRLVRELPSLRFVDVTVLHPAEEAYWGHPGSAAAPARSARSRRRCAPRSWPRCAARPRASARAR